MRLLALETATGRLSVAIVDGVETLAVAELDAPGHHARHLIPLVQQACEAAQTGLHQMEGLAVSIGPGSFTGLRVGLATMLGFRMLTGLPLAVVPTLEALAWNVREANGVIVSMLMARTGEVYWARYDNREGRLQELTPERVGTVKDAVEALSDACTVVGEGWVAHREEFHHLLGTHVGRVAEAATRAMAASAVSVGRRGHERLTRGDCAGADVAPRYVQRAEAEVRWEARHLMDAAAGHPAS